MTRPRSSASVERALAPSAAFKRFADVAAARSTNDLATELEELQMQVIEDARRLLGAESRSRILEGFRKPSS